MAHKKSGRKKSFSPVIRRKVILWCQRHSCLCKRQCGALIEIHHIDGISNTVENAMPLCFDCHAAVEHYNAQHPKGTKLTHEEMEARRDQVYDEFTRHLVPPLHFEITTHSRPFPEVGFVLSHRGNALPVRVSVVFSLFRGRSVIPIPDEQRFYNGKRLWNLNPGLTLTGHFTLPLPADAKNVEIAVELTITDVYGYKHKWLPVAWGYFRRGTGGYWALSPSPRKVARHASAR